MKWSVGMWFLVWLLAMGLTAVPAAGRAADPVKIGFVYIMSGPFATYGQFAKQGAEMAVEEINAAGGILGRPVEAFFEDSTGKPDVAVRAIRKLVYQNGVDCLIGLDSSGVAKTVVPLMPEMKTPLIITHAATPDVTGSVCNKYTFRVSVNLAQNVKAAALLAAETKAKVWTTVGPDYAFGHQSWEYFQKYLKALRADVTFLPDDQAAFAPIKTTDFSSYITKIMQAKPEGVLISLWGGNLIDFVRQASEMGFFNGDWEVLMTLGAATEVLYALGDKMPEGLWVGTRYWFLGNDSPKNVAFRDSYVKRYGQFPSYNAHGAYAALITYKAAAEKAKSVEKDAVIAALEGLTVELPVGTVTIRPEDHQALTDATWGKTASDPNFPIRILKPVKIFPAKDVTPPPEETGCTMK
ncbi:amino acid/amide ABC transporter substrate-binding protein, HAAT family [Desulfacinum infernum DSM 9756]|uniref:Amino acid/amide ABC transporter substrate-binding protein, HAAT family n=1 Tax=Desulfacinum infernum DSM 9756 TaxID=1121391 RepID=A0A1M5I3F8_9BACT|nr:ABC transporter substrate-binding protein [Desulfacinum infernum]SHG22433.1 amino acid/amide ABC transporter substrate-binding protein, HAAT family [Desulfacinum infernum DSM 9756]